MADLNVTVDMIDVIQLRQELEQLRLKAGSAQDSLDQLRPASTRLGGATQQVSQRMNQMGVVTQQAGYQVGDFLVQIQSGTNWLVAFGQQATQLVGVLPLVAGNLGMSTAAAVGLSAGLGIGIPLVTALAAVFVRTAGSAETFAKSLEELNKHISEASYLAKIASGDMDELREKFGGVSVAIADLVAAQGAVSLRDLADAAKALNAELTAMYNGNAWLNVSRAEDLGNGLDLGFKNAQQLSQALEALKNEDSLGGQIQKASDLRALFLGMVGSVDNMTSAQFEFYSRVVDTEAAFRATKNRADEMASASARVALEASGILDIVNNVKASMDAADGKRLQSAFASVFPLANQLLGLAQNIVSTIGTLPSTLEGIPGGRSAGMGGPALDPYGFRSQLEKDAKSIPSGSGSSGGGGGGGNARLESLIAELQTEQETLAIWYEESQTALQSASDAELTILGGKHEAMLRLTEEYIKRKGEIEEMGNKWSLDSALGGAAEIFGAMGAFNKKALKAQAITSAAQALISTYQGAAKELAEKGTLGFASAAAVIAKGLGFVAAIKSAGNGDTSGRGRGGGAGRGTSTVPPAAAAPTPQSVYIDSINPSDLYSGQTLINLFDALYDENDRRGKVFVVGRA